MANYTERKYRFILPYFVILAGSIIGCITLFLIDDETKDINLLFSQGNFTSLIIYFLGIIICMTGIYKFLGSKTTPYFRALITFLIGFPFSVLLLAGIFYLLRMAGILL